VLQNVHAYVRWGGADLFLSSLRLQVGDTMGILLAAMISIPLELSLCNAQVQRGRPLCKQV